MERKASFGALGGHLRWPAGDGHGCGSCDASCVYAKANENVIKN
jgi:hypothetical protein